MLVTRLRRTGRGFGTKRSTHNWRGQSINGFQPSFRTADTMPQSTCNDEPSRRLKKMCTERCSAKPYGPMDESSSRLPRQFQFGRLWEVTKIFRTLAIV